MVVAFTIMATLHGNKRLAGCHNLQVREPDIVEMRFTRRLAQKGLDMLQKDEFST